MTLEYGKKIKELREKENITQKEVASILGISRSSYNQFEQQYDIIPIKRLNQIANYFNVSIDYLLGLNNQTSYSNSNCEIDTNISSNRLKELRKELKLTQEKLANKLEINRSVIVYHELKRTIIGTPFLFTLCSKYKISADYLLGKIDSPKNL